ncbi:MAG: TIGR02281 family clan AA aspartic protease, partial [Verrucomicrobiae bacterium]|nr:TIGR02281 family clan AA aspartic protease [Verrucomicrobiae bacterium]
SESDFKYSVNTANGTTKAAAVMIDSIEVGRIHVRGVQAAVLRDNALSGTLIGMSFLNKLKSFQVSSGRLTLEQ